MATLLLDVAMEAQSKSDTCWHAAALMIWRYWQGKTGKHGPMNTLAPEWESNTAINAYQWIPLGKKTGMREVPRSHPYSGDSLHTLLTEHGPLWCAGNWYGVGHIIVLTGVDGSILHFNNPDKGVKKQHLVAWFNNKLYHNWPGCLLSKDPDAY